MTPTEFVILNLINSLSTSRITSYLVDNNQYDEFHLQLEILNSVLNFEEPGKLNHTHVYYNKLDGDRTYIEYLIIDESSLDKLYDFNERNSLVDTNYIVLFISKKINSRNIKSINESIIEIFETNFSLKEFNFINGYQGVIFYTNYHKIIDTEKLKSKRKKLSLARGTYTKILQKVKEWLEETGEITFWELMQKFEDKIQLELFELKEKDNSIDIEEQLKIFRQEYHTGAKRSQLLLHTVNEPNRVYFRNKVAAKFDLFCYTDYNTKLFDRKIKAFNHDDLNNNQIDVYYEKGEKSIKVIDFKNRYYE